MSEFKPEFLDGLEWYWLRKMEAAEGIQSLTSGFSIENARRYYGEYFLYLISSIELVGDLYPEFIDFIQESLDGYGGQSGVNNYEYIRCIRHAIIHNGIDITSAGVTIGGMTCPICPPALKNRKKEYFRFTPFLNVLALFCESIVGSAIYEFIDSKNLWCCDAGKFVESSIEYLDSMEHASVGKKQELKNMLLGLAENGNLPLSRFEELKTNLKVGYASDSDVKGMLDAAQSWWGDYQKSLIG